MRIIITLLTVIVSAACFAQNIQSLSVFAGVEQKGFRESNYYSANYNISASGSLVKPSLRLGATYLIGNRTQIVGQLSNQALFDANVRVQTFDGQNFGPVHRSEFESSQRVIDIGIRRHKKYAPYGAYYGLNLLISSTKINLIESDNPELSSSDLSSGTNINLGAKALFGMTKMISNKLFLDWGISYQFYPNNLLDNIVGGSGNYDQEFYEKEGDRFIYKENFLKEMSNELIDRCGRVALYLNIGFNHINF